MNRSRLGVVASIAALATGCSAGRYDADYAKAIEKYRGDAPFAVLQAFPVDFDDARMKVRLPQGFVAIVPGGEAPDPSRLRPRFLENLAGYQGTFERWLTTDATKLPASVAVWSLPAGDGSRAALEKSLLDKARGDEAFKNAGQSWEDRQVVPSAGGPAAWRVLSLSGPQVFESIVADNREYKRWDATCELWLSADPAAESRSLLVWRVPVQAAGELAVPPTRLAETVARTVATVQPPAADEAVAEPAKPAAGAAGF
ncbi:MAG: hypothetical protein ACKOCX_05385, partial [Planctomycetota bacterium]